MNITVSHSDSAGLRWRRGVAIATADAGFTPRRAILGEQGLANSQACRGFDKVIEWRRLTENRKSQVVGDSLSALPIWFLLLVRAPRIYVIRARLTDSCSAHRRTVQERRQPRKDGVSMTPDFLNLVVYTVGNSIKDFPVQSLCPCSVLLCPSLVVSIL